MKFLIAITLILGVVGACSKEPVPPVPPIPNPIPKTAFTVKGLAIEIEGTVKPGSKTTADRAEGAVKSSVTALERE